MRRLVAAALVVALLARSGSAHAADNPTPTGTWVWPVTVDAKTPETPLALKREASLTLKLEGDKLTGTMFARDGEEIPVQDVKWADGTLSFTAVREANGQKITTKYTGKVIGETIQGKKEVAHGGQVDGSDWEVIRGPAPKTPELAKALIGTWVVIGTPPNVQGVPAPRGQLSYYTGKHWGVTMADPNTGLVLYHHGGTYTLDGDICIATIEYATESSQSLISRTIKGRFKLEGDTLTWFGIGNPWNTVSKRAK